MHAALTTVVPERDATRNVLSADLTTLQGRGSGRVRRTA